MSDISKADLSVRVVQSPAQADQSVFVVNQKVVSGTPTTGQVPTEQADGSLAWGGPFASAGVPGTATQGGTAAAPTATRIWQFNPPADDTQHGPIAITVGGSLFQSTFDRVTYIGPNAGDGGGTITGTDSTIHLTFEQDYDDSGKRVFECYFEYTRASAVSLTDGVTTNGSPTVTSAATTFTSTRHVGQAISGAGIPANTYIGVVNSAHSIGLSSTTSPNTPVNATATATGVTLSIVPSGPTSHRFLFAQVNKATGDLHLELNATGGFSFNTTDGNQTQWGSLGPGGLSVLGLPTQTTDTSLVLAAQNGKKTVLQMSSPTASAGLLLQNTTGTVWTFTVGSTDSFKLAKGVFLAGDTNQSFTGVVTGVPLTADKDTYNCFFAGVRTSQSTSAFVVRDVDSGAYKMSIEANGDIRVLATAGIHLGTTTTGKLGLFGVTPVVQPARPTDAASIIVAGTALGIWA